jgi:type III restriction enzyme
MDSLFLQNIQKQVAQWRADGYKGVHKETEGILAHIRRVAFLHEPQIEALETYIFLKEVIGNKPSVEVFRQSFENELELIRALGISDKEAFELAYDKKKDEKIQAILDEKFGTSDYANQVYALTMGSGKTILMAVMMLYDFVLSYYHKDDERFAKNALVFAPDTTIIESLKEIKTFDYSRVLPKMYEDILLNIKYHYLESTDTALAPNGNYNVIVSNSQKIILKTRSDDSKNGTARLFGDKNELGKREVENMRLQAIRQLGSLQIFVDEAHHSYGKTLEGTLKKTRQTIDYLHKHTPLVSVVNLTGTPYVNNKMISDVVYHFGLKQGIEKGILKKVNILDYGVVRSQKFIEEVVDVFATEYGTKRLEGRLPKIAFYASNIKDLREDLKPKLERVLAERGISPDTILEYHTEAEDNADDFKQLDTAESKKQFVLLVGKGTEGWNCRSLVSVALYKKPKSTILVLQSTTRCLRSIGDNSTRASIFLSKETATILDKELKNNFASSISELNAQDQKMVEHTLEVEKRKTIKVKKVLKEILAVQEANAESIKIDFKKFKPEAYQSFVSEGGIFLGDDGEAVYKEARAVRKLEDKNDFTFYEITEVINRYTHLSCVVIDSIISGSGKKRDEFVKMANDNFAVVPYVIQEILKSAYKYEEKTEIVEEELELTKLFPFKINVQQGRNTLVVYKEGEAEDGRKGRIGFHINPYAFDSGDEKDLFRYLRDVLDKQETIKDVYFTGARVCADPSRTDFYFEYWSPEQKRVGRYFPDFLIETSKERFIVIEAKGGNEEADYVASKKKYNGKLETLTNEVLAKEIGFNEFKIVNKNFEYHIIFNASLQREQVRLYEELKKR